MMDYRLREWINRPSSNGIIARAAIGKLLINHLKSKRRESGEEVQIDLWTDLLEFAYSASVAADKRMHYLSDADLVEVEHLNLTHLGS